MAAHANADPAFVRTALRASFAQITTAISGEAWAKR
jgi:hypothetical protein